MERQFLSFKVPLSADKLTTASGTANNVEAFPCSDDMLSGVALPKSGPVGVETNGLPIFPPYNNNAEFTWAACEVDACNAHAGQGFDYHYHGDPFGSSCAYNSSDYSSDTSAHPPLIGYSLDGYEVCLPPLL